MRTHVIIFALLITVTGCKNDTVDPTDITEYGYAEDYSIYNVIMQDLSEDKNYLILLNDSTRLEYSVSRNIKYFIDHIPELCVETVENYVSINQTKIKLKNILGINFVFKSEYNNTAAKTIDVSVSRVGYNYAKTQAVVTIGIVYAPLAGSGYLIYLERNAGGWQIKKTIMTWIS